jgi:hypothetical protein
MNNVQQLVVDEPGIGLWECADGATGIGHGWDCMAGSER